MQISSIEKFKKKPKAKESNAVRHDKRERRDRRIKRAIKQGELYLEE